MAQSQVNVNLANAGFNGLNTEDSPINQDYSFATIADNAVIDKCGRIGARKAFATDTEVFPSLSSIGGASSYSLELDVIKGGVIGGNLSVICIGRNIGLDALGNEVGTDYYVFERQGNQLVELSLPAISDLTTLQYAQVVPTDDRFYIFSEGNEVMIWNGTDPIDLNSDQVGYIGIQNATSGPQVAPTFTGGVAAFGRIWGFGHEGDDNTVYYSDLLIGASNFTVDGIDPLSTAGKLNVLENWPNGRDSIQALASHNNRLIVFGRNAILVYNAGYGDPADPASGFVLEDTITNMGVVSRDAVTNIGSDVLFIDDTGVLSLGRTIQERSSPMADLTAMVRKDISNTVRTQPDARTIKLEYDSTENLVVALFSDDRLCYVLDMKAYARQGAAKVTRWTDCFFNDMEFIEGGPLDPSLIFAGKHNLGVTRYSGYSTAGGDPYQFRYYSTQLTFGEPARSKFLKQIDYTIISEVTPAEGFAKWGYDSLRNYKTKRFVLDAIQPSYFNQGEEYTVALFGESDKTLKRYRVNTSGAGEAVIIGLEVVIQGNGLSLQEINVQTLIGRLN